MQRVIALVGFVLLAVTTAAGEESWRMAGANPQRTSWVAEEVRGMLRPIWYRPMEGYIPQEVQVIAARGKVYISSARGLYALKAKDGELIWRFDTELPLGNAPTIDGAVCYVGGMDRRLHALEADSGQHLWSFDGAQAGYRTNPLVVEGKVILGNRDGHLYAIGAGGTPQQGKLLWKYKTEGPVLNSAAFADGVVFFASNDCHAYAVDSSSGRLIWKSDKLPTHGFHSWWPVVYKDWVILCGMPNYADRPMSPHYLRSEQNDLFPAEGERGFELGPRGREPGSWPKGSATMDVSKAALHFGEKPWRRFFFVLSRKDGRELVLDIDGKKGYAPITLHWKHTHCPPPVVHPSGVVYEKCMYLGRAAREGAGNFMPRSVTFGWEVNPTTGSRYVQLAGGSKAADEPGALSGAGNVLYEVVCCDREGEWYAVDAGLAERGSRGGRGSLWTYSNGLEKQCPDYAAMWLYFENRGMSGLWGLFGGPDGVYHNHGHQNPLIPYDGMLFSIKSNCVVAFGSGSAEPRKLDVIKATPTVDHPPLRSPEQLRGRLAEEIQKVLDAGHLQPGYYNAAQFIARFDHMSAYFQVPADTFYVLSRALPHLPQDQQQALRGYLQQEFAEYPLTEVAAYGWQGAPRTWADYPPEAQAMLERVKDSPVLGGRWMWPFPPHNIYALYQYAKAGLGDPAQCLKDARSKLELPARIPEAMLLEHVWQLNMYIAGCEGYLGLQKLADQAPDAEVQAERDRLRKLWVEKVELKSPWCDASGKRMRQYHKQRINVARCFIWMTPELGDYLRRHARAKTEQGLAHLNDVAPYWFNGAFEGTMGEGNLEPLYDLWLMQGRALVLGEPREELDKYLDVPAFARGDLFYILNLVTTLEAAAADVQETGATEEAAERARFVGVWKGFTVERKGENPDRGPVKLELTITEQTMRGIQIRGNERIDHGEGEYTLGLASTPCQLDAAKTNERGRKQAYVGIYELEGDTLKWCVSPQKVRPKTFETIKGQFLLILRKDKEKR
ncbi:MAG: PQQ-binding-like beta-propeller repeat protein [Planctomycetes bacterium]|nr:PQQ-binding-like beta-propeller repeat protein [Planctomycetota bacterium]